MKVNERGETAETTGLPRDDSDLDVDVNPSDARLLGLPYRSVRLFASEDRAEAVDAILSRVNCRIEVFNKRE